MAKLFHSHFLMSKVNLISLKMIFVPYNHDTNSVNFHALRKLFTQLPVFKRKQASKSKKGRQNSDAVRTFIEIRSISIVHFNSMKQRERESLDRKSCVQLNIMLYNRGVGAGWAKWARWAYAYPVFWWTKAMYPKAQLLIAEFLFAQPNFECFLCPCISKGIEHQCREAAYLCRGAFKNYVKFSFTHNRPDMFLQ